jgi:ABC-type transport system involved in cytochrome c biogenesis permease subunit
VLGEAVVLPADDPRRRDGAAVAAEALATSLRRLGEAVEPLRRHLPIEQVDADLLRYTAYPPAGSTRREVAYNESDPFRMSWVLSLFALFSFAVAIGRARGPMFWLGVGLLVSELAWTTAAFASRVAITGWAPVTNMYETVIYVPYFLALLGLCFLVAPACARGAGEAWRMTALPEVPGSFIPGERGRGIAPWLALGPRIALSALVLWVLAMAPYAAGGRTIINLLPQTDVDRSIPNLNNLVVWIVGLSMLAPAVWYVPRVILTAVASLVSVPLSWRGGHLAAALPEVYARKSFGLVVTAVAFAGTFIAWFFPIPGKQFSPLQPVLRDNFWLTIHVLTIVSSYAAGALAWGLGLLSLGYYLLGRYRPGDAGRPGKPPAACAELAGFIYKAMQVAVLLLAAGTILGGLWADVSWGRFWGWDPKEVWALVSLLAYLVILHGRYAGWIGNFGLAAGAVLGAAVIGMSWYGVNFLLGAGLHSYGFGQGGQTEFFAFLILNFALLAAAAWRWRRETAAVA